MHANSYPVINEGRQGSYKTRGWVYHMIIETDKKIYKLHIRLIYQYKTSTLTSLKTIKEVQRLLNIFM